MNEFKCPCCNQAIMDIKFLHKLEMAREMAGIPFVINSGFRCPSHNKLVGGSSNSSHLKGIAADIAIKNSTDRRKILIALLTCFNRIGIGGTFIHVDIDETKNPNVVWVYN